MALSTVFSYKDLQGDFSQSVDFFKFKKVFPDDRTDDGASQVSTAPGSRASSKNSIHDSIPRSQDSGDPKFSPQSSPKSDSSKNPSVVDVGEGTMTFVIQEIDEVDEVEQELPQQRGEPFFLSFKRQTGPQALFFF